MIQGVVNIDKNSYNYNSCRSNGTITVYVSGSILGWTSRSYSHNFKSEATYNYTRDRRVFACIQYW